MTLNEKLLKEEVLRWLRGLLRGIAPKLQTIAENTPEVYEAGKTEGIAEGKQSEYDRFWDGYLNYGNPISWRALFTAGRASYSPWNDTTFYPKYDLRPVGDADAMFRYICVTDFEKRLEECGVVLDTSQVTKFGPFFGEASFTKTIPALDLSNSTTGIGGMFAGCKELVTLRKLIVAENLTYSSDMFTQCPKLTNIEIEGVIGNDINFKISPLSAESMISIITHLKPLLGTDDAWNKTLYFNEDCWNRLEASGIPNPYPDSYSTWRDYIRDSLAWNT